MKELDMTNTSAHFSGPAWVWAQVREVARLDPTGRSGSQIVVDTLLGREDFAEIVAQHKNEGAGK